MNFSFSNLLPSDVALISAGTKPSHWRSVCNFQNLVKCLGGVQDGHKSSNINMDQPTYGCMEWTILTAGLMMTTFSYSSVWGMFNQWTRKSTAWRDAENPENEAVFCNSLWSWYQQNSKEMKNQGWHIKRNIRGIYEKWSAERNKYIKKERVQRFS